VVFEASSLAHHGPTYLTNAWHRQHKSEVTTVYYCWSLFPSFTIDYRSNVNSVLRLSLCDEDEENEDEDDDTSSHLCPFCYSRETLTLSSLIIKALGQVSANNLDYLKLLLWHVRMNQSFESARWFGQRPA
jgi:hypothetical protein